MNAQEKVSGAKLFWIGIYNLVVGAVAIFTLGKLVSAGPLDGVKSAELIFLGALTMAGAVLGGVIRCFQGIHDFGLMRDEFHPRHIGSYIIGPLAAAFLGCAIFVLARGGIFVLSGAPTGGTPQMTEVAHIALGILSGFAWEPLLAKITNGASSLLSGGSRTNERAPAAAPSTPTTTKIAPTNALPSSGG